MHKVIIVTPAGRRKYLELLAHYILQDSTIHEWHLWDNCRDDADRAFVHALANKNPKIKLVQIQGSDGTNRSVNHFYGFCKDPDVFYIKMDDDLVYLPPQLASTLYNHAFSEKDQYIWWSPLIINNAVCAWLLKYHSKIPIPEKISCQANEHRSWGDPAFAESLHKKFLTAVKTAATDTFHVPNFDVSLSRFSINCIGFFGEDVAKLGEEFCPLGVDDEEWISAVLPSKVRKPGKVIGNLPTAHFSFATQEPELLKHGILDEYYKAAGLLPHPYKINRRPLKQQAFLQLRSLKRSLFGTN